MTKKEAILKAIEIAGSPNALAEKLSVSYKTVLDWKNGRTGISPTNCIKIEEFTKGLVRAKSLLPDYLRMN